MALLEIQHLTIEFASTGTRMRVVDDLSLCIEERRTLALVGESGCGKSVTALSVARLLPAPPAEYKSGRVLVEGRDVFQMKPAELRAVRGGVVSYVFQEPAASLNPVMRVGTQIKEALKAHRPAQATDSEVIRLLKLVRIPEPETRRRDYPFQLSGGMQQRVMLAIALASGPKLLIADEPTTALDATIQAQILELLRELQAEIGMSLLLITHNLGIVGKLADRLAVMYAGQIVEDGPADAVLQSPLHPYTRALLDSVPRLGARNHRLAGIPGSVPSPETSLPGCRFAPRCAVARPQCSVDPPPALLSFGQGRTARCPYASPLKPDDDSPSPFRRGEGSSPHSKT